MPGIDFHIVNLVTVNDIIYRCFAKTAAILPMFNTAQTEYNGGSTIDGYERKKLGHSKPYLIKVG